MTASTMLIACQDPGDLDQFSNALPALTDNRVCRIVLLHVIEKIFPVATFASLGGGLVMPPPPIEAERRWIETCTEEARRKFAQFRWKLPARNPFRLRVVLGPPAESICRVAAEEMAAVILLADHRRSRIRRWLGGRTSRRVVDSAPCQVIVLGSEPNFTGHVRSRPQEFSARGISPTFSHSSATA